MSQYQRRRKRKWWRYYPYNFIIAIATLLVIIALIVSACVAFCSGADLTETAEETADLTVQPIYGAGWETAATEETPPEETPEPWTPSESDVEYIAKTVYGEALIVKSDTRRAAVVWCILNRVDGRGYPNTIEGVVTAPYQFSGYDPDHPVLPELRDLAIDVLQRWNAEKNGETEVGRVLPQNYCFFVGDGFENQFSAEWKSTDYWDWSLPSPYES